MAKYLVTGGSGFIGSALVQALADRGHHVRCFDNGWRGTKSSFRKTSGVIEMVTGDIRVLESVEAAVRGMDVVCHLAAINGTKHFYSAPDLVLEVAVRGTLNVLDACRNTGVRDLVLASSSEVYQTPPRIPTREDAPLSIPDVWNPRYSYGGGKIASELLAIHCGRKHLRRVQIIRPHNVYGPNMGTEHVVPELICRIAELCRKGNGPIRLPIQGSGNETRSFVYISDMIAGILTVMEKGEPEGIFHVGTENEVTVRELAIAIARQFGRAAEIIPGKLAGGGTSRRCPDLSLVRRLGYGPKVSLDDGIARTIPSYVPDFGTLNVERKSA